MWKQENSDSRILVLIPAYEPGERLLLLIDGLRERTDYGIVLVDDGSGGACAGIFEKAAEKGCAVLKHEKNRGKGAALKTGFCWIQENRRGTEVIVTADCDGQHTVKDIVRVAESVRPGSRELVLGSRTFQGEVPKKSRIGNMISRKMFALFTGVEVWDTQTGLRGFPSALLPWLLSIPGDRFEYEQNCSLTAGGRVVKSGRFPLRRSMKMKTGELIFIRFVIPFWWPCASCGSARYPCSAPCWIFSW